MYSNLPLCCTEHAICSGGFQNDVSGDHGLQSVEVWDVDSQSEWMQLAPMQQGRGDFALSVTKDARLLAVGGRAEIGSPALSSVFPNCVHWMNCCLSVWLTDSVFICVSG